MQIYVEQMEYAIVLAVRAYVALSYNEPLFRSELTRAVSISPTRKASRSPRGRGDTPGTTKRQESSSHPNANLRSFFDDTSFCDQAILHQDRRRRKKDDFEHPSRTDRTEHGFFV
jgi:hypothetical protein